MTARTHDLFAFASLITVTAIYPPQSLNVLTLSTSIVANIVGSLIPDMDQASNRLWDLLPAGDFLGKFLRRTFLSHRTFSHSLLGLYIFYKFFEWLLPKLLNPVSVDYKIVLASLMVGLISHIIADGLTKEGVPLLFPLKFKFGFPPLSFLRITTGSWVENVLFLPGVAVYIIVFANFYKEELLKTINLISGN